MDKRKWGMTLAGLAIIISAVGCYYQNFIVLMVAMFTLGLAMSIDYWYNKEMEV